MFRTFYSTQMAAPTKHFRGQERLRPGRSKYVPDETEREFWLLGLKVRGHPEDLRTDKIILKQDLRVWARFSWRRTETGGGLLRTRL